MNVTEKKSRKESEIIKSDKHSERRYVTSNLLVNYKMLALNDHGNQNENEQLKTTRW